MRATTFLFGIFGFMISVIIWGSAVNRRLVGIFRNQLSTDYRKLFLTRAKFSPENGIPISDRVLGERLKDFSGSVPTVRISIEDSKQEKSPLFGTIVSRPYFDPSLFHKHSLVPKNKTIVPEICVAFLSCKRIEYLRRTLKAIIIYFAQVEPTIIYEIAVLDNNSGPEALQEILNEYPIDVVIVRRQNIGIAEGLDVLFQGACRSPFILSLEDDWEARATNWSVAIPVMAMSMHVLMTDPLVLEIWLRDWTNGLPGHRNRTEWLLAPKNPSLLNGRPVMYRRLGRTPGSVWGGYTNGASLKHREKLLRVGHMKVHEKNKIVDFNGEYRYAVRVMNSGYTSAHLCLPMWQAELKCNLISTKEEPFQMLGLFAHLGGDARSPGHADFHGIEIIP